MSEVAAGLLAAVVLGGGWYVHRRIFPLKACPGCGGSGRRHGGGTTFAVCGKCGGSGKVRRFGAGERN